MDPEAFKLMRADYVNPELAEILKESGPVGGLDETTDIVALRQVLLERKRALTAANAKPSDEAKTVVETDITVPTRDGFQLPLRLYKPAANPEKGSRPVLVMIHGGGWVLGGLDNEALLCRKWCEELGGVTVNIDYRLAPEHKFPTAVHDCYDALLWTVQNESTIGGDLSAGFVVAGISAGANMAASMSHLWRDDSRSPPLTGVYLSIPSLLSPAAVPERFRNEYTSREQNKDAPILNQGSITLFRKLYEDDPMSPLMSPAIFPSGHKGLPKTYFQICGMDPLRDEGLIYETLLRESGVVTKIDLYPGLPHGFWSWWPTAEFGKRQLRDSMSGFAWLLQS